MEIRTKEGKTYYGSNARSVVERWREKEGFPGESLEAFMKRMRGENAPTPKNPVAFLLSLEEKGEIKISLS